MFRDKNLKGFTLIELLVVVAIIGFLASTVLASLQNSRIAARDAQRIQEARQLVNALELYRNQNGRYPCSGVSLLCAAGTNGGAASSTLKNNTGSYTVFAQSLRTALNFNPNQDVVSPTSLIYRVRSSTGNDNSPDSSSYTIVVYQERGNTFCEINVGPGHSGYAYSPCAISAI